MVCRMRYHRSIKYHILSFVDKGKRTDAGFQNLSVLVLAGKFKNRVSVFHVPVYNMFYITISFFHDDILVSNCKYAP